MAKVIFSATGKSQTLAQYLYLCVPNNKWSHFCYGIDLRTGRQTVRINKNRTQALVSQSSLYTRNQTKLTKKGLEHQKLIRKLTKIIWSGGRKVGFKEEEIRLDFGIFRRPVTFAMKMKGWAELGKWWGRFSGLVGGWFCRKKTRPISVCRIKRERWVRGCGWSANTRWQRLFLFFSYFPNYHYALKVFKCFSVRYNPELRVSGVHELASTNRTQWYDSIPKILSWIKKLTLNPLKI